MPAGDPHEGPSLGTFYKLKVGLARIYAYLGALTEEFVLYLWPGLSLISNTSFERYSLSKFSAVGTAGHVQVKLYIHVYTEPRRMYNQINPLLEGTHMTHLLY